MSALTTPAVVLQRGCGKGRDPWDIKRFLASKGTNMASIARRLGKHHNIVSETVAGLRNDKAVLQMLEDLGCAYTMLYPMQQPQGRAA